MYQLFGIKKCLTVFGFFCILVLAFIFWIHPPKDILEGWRLASNSVLISGLLVFLVGQTPFFPWLCRCPIGKLVFPDLDGCWVATLESNWPEISRMANIPLRESETSSSVTCANVKIKARLFYVQMSLESKNGYSKSKTIFVRASRDEENGEVRLNYMYKNETLKPEASDSGAHYGAAYLDLKEEGGMEGVYWTNRNWHNALNTAGKIVLRRL